MDTQITQDYHPILQHHKPVPDWLIESLTFQNDHIFNQLAIAENLLHIFMSCESDDKWNANIVEFVNTNYPYNIKFEHKIISILSIHYIEMRRPEDNYYSACVLSLSDYQHRDINFKDIYNTCQYIFAIFAEEKMLLIEEKRLLTEGKIPPEHSFS